MLYAVIAAIAVVLFGTGDFRSTFEKNYAVKVKRAAMVEAYEKSQMPESGYMTVEEYEQKARVKDKSQNDGEFIKEPSNSEMKYVPHPKYKIVKYNDPPGTAEINLHRKFHFDRQETLPGIISTDFSIMVYPEISYYAKTNSTECDLFVLPLKDKFNDIDKVLKANVAARYQKPIISTDRTVVEYNTFKTITPIDFSPDNSKLIAKEKIGNAYDGIWQTQLIVYDFQDREIIRLPEIREAIRYYWKTRKDFDLRDVRWDIYPLGFDANDSDRVVVSAYAYTGKIPRFLGVWSIDCEAKQSRLISIENSTVPISIVGFKIKRDGIIDPKTVIMDAERTEKLEKIKKKQAIKASKQARKASKKAFQKSLREMKKEVLKEEKAIKKKKEITGLN